MFKSAATKIAHNSTIPSLAIAGNKDLRPLQDLITAEKSIVQSLVKLSTDFTKASEALKHWAVGEGDDLGDTLTASTTILLLFASAISKFASHEQTIRDHMKAIRSGEESLDQLKHRRKNVASKADSAEKKLNKMSPEHKNTPMQTELLNKLRDEMRMLDSDIMTDEAKLGDMKRTNAKAWMTLKFAGLQEWCEKGVIIGESGKAVINEIPQDVTEPGTARPYYNSYQQTADVVAETQQALSGVVFHGEVGSERSGSKSYDSPSLPRLDTGSGYGSINEFGAMPEPNVQRSHSYNPSSPAFSGMSMDQGHESGFRSPTAGGQFASFPARAPHGRTGSLLASPRMGPEPTSSSFSTSVADALGSEFLGQQSSTTSDSTPTGPPDGMPRMSYDSQEPVPRYESYIPNEAYNQQHSPENQNFAPPSGPPPGAAAPSLPQYRAAEYGHEWDDNEGGLAYMAPGSSPDDRKLGTRGDTATPRRLSVMNGYAPEPSGPPQQVHDEPPRAVTPPTPPPPSTMGHTDESALNAAAAREVSRELDSLSFSPPPTRDSRNFAKTPEPIQTIPRAPDSPSHITSPFTRARDRDPTSPTQTMSPPLRSPVERTSDVPQIPSPRQSVASPLSSPTLSSTLPQPPAVSLPPPSSFAGSVGTGASGNTPYRTPPEYMSSPIGTSAPSPIASFSNLSKSSLNMSSPSSPSAGAGIRTISAAAFRRPQNRMPSDGNLQSSSRMAAATGAGVADTTPLSVNKKRGLPSTPKMGASALGGGHGGGSNISLNRDSTPLPSMRKNPDSPPALGDEDFDYISAYVNNEDNAATAAHGSEPAAGAGGRGYEGGRFATNLDDGAGLR